VVVFFLAVVLRLAGALRLAVVFFLAGAFLFAVVLRLAGAFFFVVVFFLAGAFFLAVVLRFVVVFFLVAVFFLAAVLRLAGAFFFVVVFFLPLEAATDSLRNTFATFSNWIVKVLTRCEAALFPLAAFGMSLVIFSSIVPIFFMVSFKAISYLLISQVSSYA